MKRQMVGGWRLLAAMVVAVLGLVSVPAAQATLLDGLQDYWTFDDSPGSSTAADSWGSKPGTITNAGAGMTLGAPGKIGTAFAFNGAGNGYVQVGSVGISGTAARSIAGWVKGTANVMPDWVTAFGFTPSNGAGEQFFDIEKVNNGQNLGLHVYNWNSYVNGAVDGNWHYLVATYDGSNIKTYSDGSLVDNTARNINTFDQFRMGYRQDQNNYWNGSVDEVAVWNRVLTAAEVSQIWNGGAGLRFLAQSSGKVLTWDGSGVDNWNNAPSPQHWTGGNVGDYPKVVNFTGDEALVNSGTCTVSGNEAAYSLGIGGTGSVVIGPGRTLTIQTNVTATGSGALTLQDGSKLAAEGVSLQGVSVSGAATIDNMNSLTMATLTMQPNSRLATGGGSATLVKTNGNATIGGTGTLTATAFTDQGIAGTFTLQGTGTMSLDNTTPGTVVGGATTFRLEGGTLRSKGADPLGGSTSVVLAGGTLSLTANTSILPTANVLRERLFDDVIGDDKLDPIGVAPGYVTRNDYYYEGNLTTDLAFDGNRWNNAPKNGPGPRGGNLFDQIGGLWFGKMTIGGTSPLQPGTITLATNSDDGSVWWVDLDKDGLFSHSGSQGDEMIVNNKGWHGGQWRFGVLSGMTAGDYDVAMAMFEDGGGEYMEARFAQGNTNGNEGAMIRVSPGAASNANLFKYLETKYLALNRPEMNFTVEANSGLTVKTDFTATFGALNFKDGVLTLVGPTPNLSFASVSIDPLAKRVGFNSDTNFNPGPMSGNGFGGTFAKAGAGDLVLDPGNTGFGNATFQPEGGRLITLGTGPLNGAKINFAGGEMVFASTAGGLTVNNAITATTGYSKLTAGKGGLAGAADAQTVTIATPPVLYGGTLRLQTTDGYTLNVPNLTLKGGTLEVEGAPQAFTGLVFKNALEHRGFNYANEPDLNLNANKGLMAVTPSGRALFTNGPNGVGLRFNNDADFAADGAITQADNFMNLFIGKFNAPATGAYEFRYGGGDDRGGFWIDLNQDGIFQAPSGANSGEWIRYQNGNTAFVNLTAGQSYTYALEHLEWGGGSNIEGWFRTPAMGAQVAIQPGDPAQAGMWDTVATNMTGPGNIDRTATNILVDGGGGINAITYGQAAFGHLTMRSGILTTATSRAASSGISFLDTTVDPSASGIGFETNCLTRLGPLNANGLALTIVEKGSPNGALVLDQPGTGLQNTTFDIQGSRLITIGTAPVGGPPPTGAKFQLSGGELVLASAGGALDVFNRITSTADSTLTAGTGGLASAAKGAGYVYVYDFHPDAGVVTLRATDGYMLDLANGVSGAGGIDIAAGPISIRPGTPLNVATLRFSGGTLYYDKPTINVNRLDITGATDDVHYLPTYTFNVASQIHLSNAVVNNNLAGAATLYSDAGLNVLNGVNTYTGSTILGGDSILRVLPNASNLPNGWLQFQRGQIETSGTFARRIGLGPGQIHWDDPGGGGRGGFSAYGGDLTVTLTRNDGQAQPLQMWDYWQGFNGQQLWLNSQYSTNVVTLTNDLAVGGQWVRVNDNPATNADWARFSGRLTNAGNWMEKSGPGVLELTNTTSDAVNLSLRGGALRVGQDGQGLPGGIIRLTWSEGAYGGIIETYGTLARDVASYVAGRLTWEDNGGGFAAYGPTEGANPLTVTLNSGAQIQWNSDNGFRGRQLLFGSTTANNVVTFTNPIDFQGGDRYLRVFDNPKSPSDYARLTGALTGIWRYHTLGDGKLVIEGDLAAGENLYFHETSTTVVNGNVTGNYLELYDGARLDVNGTVAINDQIRLNRSLAYSTPTTFNVTGDVTARYFWAQDVYPTISNIGGSLTTRDNMDINGGTHTIGQNLISQNSSIVTRNGAQVTVGNDITARYIQTESGSLLHAGRDVSSTNDYLRLYGGSRLEAGRNLYALYNVELHDANTSLIVGGNATANYFWTEWNRPTNVNIQGNLASANGVEFNSAGGTFRVNGNYQVNGGWVGTWMRGGAYNGVPSTLIINGQNSFSPGIEIANGTRLAGTGHIRLTGVPGDQWQDDGNSAFRFPSGGILSPGDPTDPVNHIGTITLEGFDRPGSNYYWHGLLMQNGSFFDWEIGPNGTHDMVEVLGNVYFDPTVVLRVSDGGGLVLDPTEKFEIMHFTGNANRLVLSDLMANMQFMPPRPGDFWGDTSQARLFFDANTQTLYITGLDLYTDRKSVV